VANVFGELRDAIGKLDLPLARVIDAVKRLGDAPKLSPNDLREEIDHLQRDAMNWVSDGRSLRSAELRLVEARRLIAEAVRRERASAPLLALRGYVEKTAGQICDGRRDARGAKAAYGAAARYFRAALKLDPSDVSALNGQANILGIQGQHQKAVTLGRVVTSYCPDYTAAFWDLSIELEQLVDPKKPAPNLVRELADVYETLVELIPNEPSGFTPAELATAQRQAHHYRELATQLGGAHAHPHRGRRTS
jgi:tetratricopeptide (TPR) repeat protein